eukprot:1850206-Pleurochrysis_carterae.AAC.1
MASSRSSWAASSAGGRGTTAAPESAALRTQSAAPISKERGLASEAKSTFPMATSRFSSTTASVLTSAALPDEGRPWASLDLCRFGQSRC